MGSRFALPPMSGAASTRSPSVPERVTAAAIWPVPVHRASLGLADRERPPCQVDAKEPPRRGLRPTDARPPSCRAGGRPCYHGAIEFLQPASLPSLTVDSQQRELTVHA